MDPLSIAYAQAEPTGAPGIPVKSDNDIQFRTPGMLSPRNLGGGEGAAAVEV